MTERVWVRGDAILRQSLFPAPTDHFRFVVRWMLSTQENPENGEAGSVRFPRVAWSGNGDNFVSDSFQLRIFREPDGGGMRQFFNEESLQFTDNDSSMPVSPQLNAIIKPVSKLRRVRERNDRDGRPLPIGELGSDSAVWCATDDNTMRQVVNGTPVSDPEYDSMADPNTVPDRYSLSVRDILFDSDRAAARGEQFLLLYRRMREVTKEFDPKQKIEEFSARLKEEKDFTLNPIVNRFESFVSQFNVEELCWQLTLECLASGTDGVCDPAAIIRTLPVDARERFKKAFRVTKGLRAETTIGLLSDSIKAMALARRHGEGSTEFIQKLKFADTSRETARESLFYSGAHGGRWYVYNNAIDCETDAPLAQIAAPELLGCGYISPKIPAANVREWARESERWRFGITIEPTSVDARIRQEKLINGFSFESDPAETISNNGSLRIWFKGAEREYVSLDKVCIGSEEFSSLTDEEIWSTSPIVPPASCELFLDAVQLSVETKHAEGGIDEAKPSFPTAETNVQLLIGQQGNGESAIGFNVYAEWADTDREIAGWNLADLHPWLINSRYSFLCDIYHASGAHTNTDEISGEFKKLISCPPPNPVVRRPTLFEDAGIAKALEEGDDELIEDQTRKPLDIYTVCPALSGKHTFQEDLRIGTLPLSASVDPGWADFENAALNFGIKWDPNGLIDGSVTAKSLPAHERRAGIDRYFFYVTTTDIFGQESAPVRVDTSSEFFSRNGVEVQDGAYRPVSRTQCPPPPSLLPNNGGPRNIKFHEYHRKLTVEFGTPRSILTGTYEDASNGKDLQDKLNAELLVLRRFVKHEEKRDDDKTKFRASRGRTWPVVLDDEWDQLLEFEARHGWRPFRGAVLEQSDHSGLWSWTSDGLSSFDHGYQYKAAIRFRYNDDARHDWFPDEPKRIFHQFIPSPGIGGEMSAKSEPIPETVTKSKIVQTNVWTILDTPTRSLIPVGPVPKFGVTDLEFITAAPVGAIPMIDRDALIMKMISQPVINSHERSGIKPNVEWPADDGNWKGWDGGKYWATLGQSANINAVRSRLSLEAYEPRWRPFFEILAQSVATPRASLGEETPPRTKPSSISPIIGLRGAIQLEWEYRPNTPDEFADVNDGQFEYINASLFRVHQARVPDGVQQRQGGRQPQFAFTPKPDLIFTLDEEDIKWKDASQTFPSVFVLANIHSGHAIVAELAEVNGNEFTIKIRANQPQWRQLEGAKCRFAIYEFEHIWSVPVNDFDTAESTVQRYRYFFPVGGGLGEEIFWRINSESSAHAQSRTDIVLRGHFDPSITPPPVTGLKVSPVVDRSEAWYIAADHQPFFPNSFNDADTQAELIARPRILLTWDSGELTESYGIAIFKERKSLLQSPTKSAGPDPVALHAAAQRIVSTIDGEAIEASDVALLDPWLKGQFNWKDGFLKENIFWPAAPYLSAKRIPAAGIRLGGSKSISGFLDYFHNDALPETGSETLLRFDHSYRYSLASYIDLGDHPTGSARFLLSQATPFSLPVTPPTPKWELSETVVEMSELENLIAPRVEFEIEFRDARDSAVKCDSGVSFSVEAIRVFEGANSDIQHHVPFDRPLRMGPSTRSGTITFPVVGRLTAKKSVLFHMALKVGMFASDSEANKVPFDSVDSEIKFSIPPVRGNGEMLVKIRREIILL